MNPFSKAVKKTKDFFAGNKKGIAFLPFMDAKTEPSRIVKPQTFFDRSVYFSKALEKRAGVVGGVDIKAYRNDTEVEELNELIKNPNDFLSGDDFWYLVQLYYDLYGVYYIWKEPSGEIFRENQIPEKLHLLNPREISFDFDKQGNLIGFKNIAKGEYYEPEEIIWEHRPDPEDYKKPRPILNEGGKDVLRTEIELREYQKKLARSDGRINGVFSFDTENGLSEKQITDLKKQWQKKIREARGSEEGRLPHFMGGKADYIELSRSPREIEYNQSKKAVLEEVSTITEVPKTLLSSFDEIKFSNAEEARKTFLEETIKPLIKRRVKTLQSYLAPEGIELQAEEITEEDFDKKMKRLETANKVAALTLNELREELGKEEVEGGDDIYAPLSLAPLQSNPNQQENE